MHTQHPQDRISTCYCVRNTYATPGWEGNAYSASTGLHTYLLEIHMQHLDEKVMHIYIYIYSASTESPTHMSQTHTQPSGWDYVIYVKGSHKYLSRKAHTAPWVQLWHMLSIHRIPCTPARKCTHDALEIKGHWPAINGSVPPARSVLTCILQGNCPAILLHQQGQILTYS